MATGSSEATPSPDVPRDINSRTVLEIITSAYRKFGTAEVGEALSAALANDGLIAFQDLVSELAGEGITVPIVVQDTLTLVIDQVSYTIGQSGATDLDTLRPELIVSAFVRAAGTTNDYPVRIIGQKAYDALFDKSASSGSRPRYLWYNPTAPNGALYVYRAPSAADSLIFSSKKPFVDGAGLTDDVTVTMGIPRNYQNPLIWMLAEELGPESGVDPSIFAMIQIRAERGKRSIQSLAAAQGAEAVPIEFARGRNYYDDLNPYR